MPATIAARGRLISKAIVCKSGGNFVTAAISVIKRTLSLSLARSLAYSLAPGLPPDTGIFPWGGGQKLFHEISKH